MGTPQAVRSLEPIFIGVEFPFDLPSSKLQRMKQLLMSGVSMEIASTDLPNGYGEKNTPEVVASFFVVNDVEYLHEMRAVHGEYMTETPCESVMRLGSACDGTKRITDALFAGCNVYLISEEDRGVFGRYTLCVVASPLSK
ncbi:MAG: hypothetical protein AAB869_00820 [Patescibacteria group bacterium]